MNSARWIRRGVLLVLFLLLGMLLFGGETAPSASSVQAVHAQTEPLSNVISPPPGQFPVEVYVDLYGLNIFRIDEQEETFEIEAFLYADWFDDRLVFDPEVAGTDIKVFQGETAVEMLKTEVWWPDLEVVDSRGSRDRLHITLTIDYDGFVTYTERFHANIWQPFFFEEFPFDYHELSFTVAPFFYENTEVIFIGPEDFATEIEREEQLDLDWTTNEWLIESVQTSVDPGEEFDFSTSTLFIEISRLPQFYISNVIIPLVLIVAISWAVFWMDFGNMHLADRLSVSFTSVLTVVAFDFVTASNLPRLPYQTVLDRAITFSYIILTLSVLENVLAYLQYKKNEAEIQRIDRVARWLFPLVYLAGFVIILILF
ncbi:hypothetical protein [Candidatus Leptofilum sp.]|uniref:hypothetical protein n=1 Tax=Candidatus Leptofilum sp. TaxID=3241576 RepID=UPI003B5CFD8E